MRSDWRKPAPGVLRVENGSAVMLYDPFLAGNLTPAWFEPRHWQKQGAVSGAARGRGATLFFRVDGGEYALRHCRRGGLVARLLGDRYLCLGEHAARPVREFLLTHFLWRLGLPVAPPVAVRLVRNGLIGRGDLVTRRIDSARTLAMRLVAGDLEVRDWLAVGRTIAQFHAAGVRHADLNAHNVLFDAEGTVYLIDFDRGAVQARGLWCDANLVRLRRSILKICDALSTPRLNETLWAALLAGYRDATPRPA